MTAEEILRDLDEIDQRLMLARRLSPPSYTKSPAYHPEYFPIFDVLGRELKTRGHIVNWRAHLAGVRHKTVNALLLTQNQELIIQCRASSTIFFPSRYTASVGGHVSHCTSDASILDHMANLLVGEPVCHDSSIKPIDKVVAETHEELGLEIDASRFIPLGDADRGIPNFLHAWRYKCGEISAMFTVFDLSAEHIGRSLSSGPRAWLTDKDAARIKGLVQQETRGGLSEQQLCGENVFLFTRNIELCQFYTVVVTQEEVEKITFTDGEVAGFRIVTLDDLTQAGRELDTTTDSLYILFYERDDIANELRSRLTDARRR